MPFLLDSVMGELAERGVEARLVVHPVFTVTRDPSGRLTGFEGLRALGRRRVARELHPYPPRPHRRRGAAGRIARRARDGARGRAARRRGLAGDDGARRRDRRRAQGQSAAAAEGGDRGGGRVPRMAGRRQLHLPRRPRLRLHRQGGRAGAAARDRARPVALARPPRAAHRHPARAGHAGAARLPDGAEAPDRHQVGGALEGAPAHAHGLYRHQALRCRRQAHRRVPHRRPVHVDGLHALDPHHSVPAPQGRRHHQARRLRSRRSFRQGAGQRARYLFARRAVPDRRGHALPVRDADPAARRAAARAGAVALRQLRPLRLGLRVRAARPLQQRGADRDRRSISPRSIRAASAPTIRSSRKGRWCASISSSAAIGGDMPAPAPRGAGRDRRRRSSAPGPTACPMR